MILLTNINAKASKDHHCHHKNIKLLIFFCISIGSIRFVHNLLEGLPLIFFHINLSTKSLPVSFNNSALKQTLLSLFLYCALHSNLPSPVREHPCSNLASPEQPPRTSKVSSRVVRGFIYRQGNQMSFPFTM